jgi:hypothetical protein
MIINTSHRGRTATGKYAYRPLLEPEPDDFPPDSIYWENQAWDAHDRLIDVLGVDAYLAWVEENISDGDTWRAIAEKEEGKLHDLSIQQTEGKS